jgi:hypothetical protein
MVQLTWTPATPQQEGGTAGVAATPVHSPAHHSAGTCGVGDEGREGRGTRVVTPMVV